MNATFSASIPPLVFWTDELIVESNVYVDYACREKEREEEEEGETCCVKS